MSDVALLGSNPCGVVVWFHGCSGVGDVIIIVVARMPRYNHFLSSQPVLMYTSVASVRT